MFRHQVISAAAIAVVLAGCSIGQARVIERKATGGVIGLEGDHRKAMSDASDQMEKHCRGPYHIVRQGEEGTGKEWRVHYGCGAAPPPTPAAPPPAGKKPVSPPPPAK